MVQATNKITRSMAVLALPKRVGALVAYATAVVKGMTGNPTFSSPTPPLATVSAAIADLQEAEAVAMTRTMGAASARDVRRRALVATLQMLRIHVQAVADQNADGGPAIIRSAGMAVKRSAMRPPRAFAAFPGAASGSVKIIAPAAGHRASYDWQSSPDGAAWTDLGTTLQAHTTVSDQAPGTTLRLRYRAVTRAGQADWSAPITFTVR